MRCDLCQGTGWYQPAPEFVTFLWNEKIPCPECHGNGITYCCEGSERYGQLKNDETGKSSRTGTAL